MKKNTALNSRELIRALIHMHNTSQGKIVDAAGLVRQNVSSWLSGRADAITEEKILHLLNTLGIEHGLPRTDMVHRWCVKDVNELASVLATILYPELEVNLLKVHLPSHPGTAILQIQDSFKSTGKETAWIVLYRPALNNSPDPITVKAIGIGSELDVIIDKEQWESWLPPNSIDVKKFHKIADKLANQAMLSAPVSNDQGMEKMIVMYYKALKKMPASEILSKTKLALGL